MPVPKITIITPSYNQGQYLEQTIDSVLSQDYPKLEYMVIDGGSSDQSVEIIKKYQQHLDWWVSEPDQGQGAAINKGMGRATGEVINWLNSDDYYQPNALNYVGDCFTDPTVRVLCARSRIFDENGLDQISRGTDIYQDNLAKTVGWARIDQPETFFRKYAYDQVGWLNAKLRFVMDKEWFIRYLLRFGLEGIQPSDRVLVNFRHHQSSKTVTESDGFIDETHQVFLSYSRHFGFKKETALLEKLVRGDGDIGMHFLADIDLNLMRAAMHFHILLTADQFYYHDNRPAAGACLEAVDPQLLDPEGRGLLNRLKFRTRFLPLWIKNLIGKR